LAQGGLCDFFANVQMTDSDATVFYGAPASMWIRYTVRSSSASLAGIVVG